MKFPIIDKEKTGGNIKSLCEKRGFTVRYLQHVLHIGASQTVYYWFNGHSLPSIETLLALSVLLDVSIYDILVLE